MIHKKEKSEYDKKYLEINRDKIIKRQKEFRKNNKEKITLYRKNHRKKNHKEIDRKNGIYIIKREKYDIGFKIANRLRHRTYSSLIAKNASKNFKFKEYIGCSISKLKAHLEEQFTKGMSWNNYGKWEIDHVRPCASFDLSKPEEQLECFNYKNLQPLWAKDNMKKGGKYYG